MKKLLFLLAFILCFSSYAQQKDEELMYMVLENFTYQAKTKKLKFDLVIKNNSNKTLYFVKPKNYFFSNHNDKKDMSSEYGLYYSKPYYITVSPYRSCDNPEDAAKAITDAVKEGAEEVVEIEEVVEETVIESTETDETEEIVEAYETDDILETTEETAKEAVEAAADSYNNSYGNAKKNKYKLIAEIVELPAGAFKKYRNIEIERKYSTFCDDEDYKIMVDYYSSASPLDYYAVEQFKGYLKDNNTEAIDLLFENELKALKKDSISNTENLKNILKVYNGLQDSNSKTYKSNTIGSNK